MSIDKDDPDEPKHGAFERPPIPQWHVGRRFMTWLFTWLTFGPVVMLPLLLLIAVIWGVVGRVCWELFSFSWDLFGF